MWIGKLLREVDARAELSTPSLGSIGSIGRIGRIGAIGRIGSIGSTISIGAIGSQLNKISVVKKSTSCLCMFFVSDNDLYQLLIFASMKHSLL